MTGGFENAFGFLILSHRTIFLYVLVLQLIDRFLVKSVGKIKSKNTEQIQLRKEIRQLLKEAESLSTPSTFSQAAKLRRVAASKEKELKKYQEGQNNENKNMTYHLSGRNLFITKVVVCLWLIWQFWGVPVIIVPRQLLQPFGRMFSWNTPDPLTGLISVGIIPWLLLSFQVSRILSQKISNVLHL
ncbi:hypothetical protein ZOSMA_251G00120 [Zostera marina]|uniref:Tail-anchored protein insertion receptor WRB n=1 Tax=Zostera marina TaxID=29655 RepID=A0A0K9PG53_ZOSMR|nr:hypothetical protein ZOSMA_251G00120 [Zostera marina]